jgi:TonB-dependent starch-binding outer membrane protein SusC
MIMKKLYRCLKFGAVFLLLLLTVPVFAQVKVSGTILDDTGQPLPGVSILEKGTSNGTTTDTEGKYSLNVAGSSSTLVFSFIGYTTIEEALNGRSAVDLSMQPDVTALQEVVVTGYTSERKQDIIGAVAVVSNKDLVATPAANITSQLQGRAAGVTVSAPGQPGGAASIRIRGFTTFGNNNPLYVIDGVPTEDATRLNPQDIESIQVLKDATSSSIYGARAANGVIIVQTKQGKKGVNNLTIDSYYGTQKLQDSGFPDMMNTQQYADYVWASNNNAAPGGGHPIFGNGTTPSIPSYMVTGSGGTNTNPLVANPALYSIDPNAPFQVMETSAGTDWFKVITQPAKIQSHQISATGGSDKATYNIGFNYFDQDGTIKLTNYKRYTVRANTSYRIKDFLRVGENMQIAYQDRLGGDQRGEGGAWAQAFRMVPYIPVYDVNGNFAGNSVTGSGNGSNPLADLTRQKDNKNYGYGIFGNIFGEVDILKSLTYRSSFGIDYNNEYQRTLNGTTFERSENIKTPSYTEQFGYNNAWTWTNTLKFDKTFADVHNLKLLAGTEAIKRTGRLINANRQTFDFQNIDFLSLNRGQSTPGVSNKVDDEYPGSYVETLYSVFGRLDYGFNEKYLINATIRRDGSSKFGEENRYATFPAFGAAWRISEESFMQGIDFISEFKLRGGWGQMGSMKNVPAVNQYSVYGSIPSQSWYAIDGQNNGASIGYRQLRQGSAASKWETAETTNVGFDAALANGKLNVSFDVFNTQTKGLLYKKSTGPVGGQLILPYINVGTMLNKGFDASIGYNTVLGSDIRLQTTVTFTHYTNEVQSTDGNPETFISLNDRSNRQTGAVRIQQGHPMGAFYGYQIDGFYDDAAEIASSPTYGSARVGGWKLKDLNGDNKIDENDRTFIGTPIPKFQMGFNINLAYKNFDFTTFLFWNYGNDIYNFTKYFTHLRGFVGGVSQEVAEQAWTEANKGSATLPSLQASDAVSASIVSDYYIESGSYLRAKNVQLGYTVPSDALSKFKIEKLRIYVQAQNLFTITKYTGADPDISIQNVDNNDRILGMDQAGYPNSKQFLVGLSLGF